MIRLCLLCAIFCWVSISFSQKITIIDGEKNLPLKNIDIQIAGKLIKSDSLGKVSLEGLTDHDTIKIDAAGYQTMSLPIAMVKKNQNKVVIFKNGVLLDEFVVSSFKDETYKHTSINIVPIKIKDIESLGSYSLTDALARTPGVTQFSTGLGISKPVIRGLYGSRILVLFSGLRFDNQQWQDEHGLGLSDLGLSKVELIKGPLSILYGTDAIGGVINIIEEDKSPIGTIQSDGKIEFHTNTVGGTLQAGVKTNNGKRWSRFRLGVSNHADYRDGNGARVLNSRFNGYYGKLSLGFKKKRWTSENHYHFSYNNFGFIFNDLIHFMDLDSRWTRVMNGPHHIVMLHVFSSINEMQFKKSSLKWTVGAQSNYRTEDEGGGELSLKMLLLTGQYQLKWLKSIHPRLKLVLANAGSIEKNINYGKRKIVPDALMSEENLSVYLEHTLGKKERTIVEYGAGGGMKGITTLLTPRVNSPEKDIEPFQQVRPFGNALIGITRSIGKYWNVKLNASTGVRAPNLAELSSNGLHEGIYTYEIGDPNMSNERNANLDAGIFCEGEVFQLQLSGFYNSFKGYIFLDPTNEEWYGFPIYRFRQQAAQLYGGEVNISITPQKWNGWKFSSSYSGLVGVLASGEYIPWMPAQKLKPEVRYEGTWREKHAVYTFVNNEFVWSQTLLNPSEVATPSYQLLNAGFGIQIEKKKISYNWIISCNNLLNEAYYDHLSRLKNYGFLNVGRDITLTLRINLINNLKQNKNEKYN